MGTSLLAAVFFLLAETVSPDDTQVVFALITHHHHEQTRSYLEPIALLHRVSFGPDHIEFLRPPPQNDFVAKYYGAGAKYRVLRGGVPAGEVTVLPSDNNTCQPVERLVERTGPSARADWRAADAIAVGPVEISKHASVPRSPTATEQHRLIALVRDVFALKAVPVPLAAPIREQNVIAIDLDGDDRTDFIGTFNVDDARNRHTLFVVVMGDGAGALRADVIRYDRTPRAKDEIAAKHWTLVDVEDFDGDGIDEIIVANHGWEWTSYDILKMRREGEWDVMYSGGGSGC